MAVAGRALQIYENKVAPILQFANVETEMKIMEHSNHAMEVVMEMPLGVYDCVVAVGGDGSLYESTYCFGPFGWTGVKWLNQMVWLYSCAGFNEASRLE